MRVAVNARHLSTPALRGWNRYTINLLAELPALGVELLLYSDCRLHESHLARLPEGAYRVRVAPRMRYALWEQWWLPRRCATDRADVLHSPANYGLPWFCPCPRVLTLHDAIMHMYADVRLRWRQKLRSGYLRARVYHWIARTRAEQIITGSEHAKRDLVRRLSVPARATSVVYQAADPRFHEPVSAVDRRRVRQAYGLAKPYVLYVGGWEERKNVTFLLRAFAAADLHDVELVLVGGGDDQQSQLARLPTSVSIRDRLHLIGSVPDADLPVLYGEALCFAYPSEYEGFGLQLCEAMATGCPTLAARATSLPEVLGSGGETFGLADVTELAALLRRVAADGTFRAELVRRALRRAGDFSWARTARSTVGVYDALLRTHRKPHRWHDTDVQPVPPTTSRHGRSAHE